MKYLALLLWAAWGLFLVSGAVGIYSNEQYRSSDVSERDFHHSDFKCPLWFGAFSDPHDCAHYYICMAGKAFHKKCGLLQHFCILRRMCMPILIAVCGSGKGTTDTPDMASTSATSSTTSDGGRFKCPNMFGSFPHPKDCSKYYVCRMYMQSLKTCPENELFDAVKNKCKPEKEVNCGDRERPGFSTTAIPTEHITGSITETGLITTEIPTETTTESITQTESITTEIPTETTTEIITQTESTTTEITTETTTEIKTETESTTEEVITDTSQPTIKDIITTTYRPTGPPEHNCDEDDVDCIITETGDVEDWFICPQDVGSYAHPSSDKLFIFCMNWIPSVKKCGMDLVFSKDLSTCVMPTYLM